MDDNFRKIVATNLKISIDFKVLTETEVEDIIKNNKVINNIDDAIWYLYNGGRSKLSVSWL